MSDQVTASTNLTKRGSTYHFVLRVPKDLVGEIGRARIQFSLGTSSEIEARRLALPEAEKWETRFQELRAKKGLVAEKPVPGALDTSGWTWPDWEALARWFGARMLDEDYEARLRISLGTAMLDPAQMKDLGNWWLGWVVARLKTVRDYTMLDYGEHCLADVQRAVAPSRRLASGSKRAAPTSTASWPRALLRSSPPSIR